MKEFYMTALHTRLPRKAAGGGLLVLLLLLAVKPVAAQNTFDYATNPLTMTMTFPSRMLIGDFDRDGDQDILYQSGNSAGVGFGYVRNNGAGSFTDFPNANSVGTPFTSFDFSNGGVNAQQLAVNGLFVVDYDGDGDVDIVDREGGYLGVWRNDPGGFVYAPTNPFTMTMTFPGRMIFGDFDNDGDQDVLYQSGNTGGAGFGYVVNNGGGSFTDIPNANAPATPFASVDFATGAHQVAANGIFVLDYDGDGDVDIIDREGGTVGVWRNNGGTFALATNPFTMTMAFPGRMVFGDFDRDGDQDALYQTNNVAGQDIGYLKNNGAGNFTDYPNVYDPATPFNSTDLTLTGLQVSPAGLFVMDYDNDFDVDLLDRENSGGLAVLRQLGVPPVLSSTTPADNATNVATNTNIQLVINETVTKKSGNIYIYRGDGTLIETISVNSAQVTGSGTTWTIDPSVTLSKGTNYYIRYDDGIFHDVDLQILPAITNATTFNFQTAPPANPVIGNLGGDAVSYGEDQPTPSLIDDGDNATVTDGDSPSFNGGNLTLNLFANGQLGDVMSIVPGATITVTGNIVRFNGTAIGTFTGGTNGAALVVSLNANATPATVAALIRSIGFSHTGDTPAATARSISLQLNDGDGGSSAIVLVSLTVIPNNDAPQLSTSTPARTINEDAATPIGDLTLSDPDAGGSTVSLTLAATGGTITGTAGGGVTYTGNGTATIVATGTIADLTTKINAGGLVFTPASNDVQAVTINVTLDDLGNTGTGGAKTATTAIAYTITAVNDAPVNTVPALINVVEDQASQLTGISVSDVDAGNAAIRITLSVTSGTLAATSGSGVTVGGTATALTLTGSGTNLNAFIAAGNVTFTATTDADVTMNVLTSDEGNTGGAAETDTDAITLRPSAVNDAPTINITVNTRTMSEDGTLAVTGVVLGDEDAAAAAITVTYTASAGTFTAATSGGVTVSNNNTGTVTLTGTLGALNAYLSAGSNITYNAAVNANGSQQLNVTVDDGGNTGSGGALSASANIDVTITAINDAPTVAAPANILVTEDTPLGISGISFSDGDAAAGTVSVTFSVPGGSFTGTSAGGVTVAGSGTGTLTLTGSINDINSWITGNFLQYAPAAQANGNVTMTVTINDNGLTGTDPGGASPTSEEATATVVLNISAVNDAPVITAPATITGTEDAVLSLPGISLADVDADPSVVTMTWIVPSGTLNASNGGGVTVTGSGTGTLTLNGTQTAINAFITANNVTYTSPLNVNGDIILTLNATDNGATGSGGTLNATPVTVTLQFTAVNDAPTIPTAPATFAVSEDVTTPLTGLSFADTDAGTATVKVTLTAASGTYAATSGNGVTVAGVAGGITLDGSQTDINAFIAAGSVTFVTDANSTTTPIGAVVRIDDNGNSGTGGNLFATANFDIIVTAVNDTPAIATPGAQSFDMNTVLTFATGNSNTIGITDVDLGTSALRVELLATNGVMALPATTGLTITTGSGTGDAEMIFTGTLTDVTNALDGLTYTPGTHYFGPAQIRVVVSDQGATGTGGALTDTIIIPITVRPTDPLILDITSPAADGSYKLGDVIPVTISFNMPVMVTGTPMLGVETGATDRMAVYSSGSGTQTLMFSYTVQAGDLSTDLDYVDANALTFNGGTIKNAAGLDANLTLPAPGATHSLGANKALVIDGVVPTITSVNVPASATYVAGQVLSFTVNISENIIVNTAGGTPSLSLNIGGAVKQAAHVAGGPANTLTFTYTVAVGDEDMDGIGVTGLQLNGATVQDAPGNNLVLTLNNVGPLTNVKVDAINPVITRVDVPAAKTWKAGEVLNFSVVFSEPVIIGGAMPTLDVAMGAVNKSFTLTAGLNTPTLVFSYTVVAGDLDTDGITPAAAVTLNGATIRDAAGNNAVLTLNAVGNTSAVFVDAVVPVITAGQIYNVDENTAAGTVVATIAATDPGSTGTLRDFTIVTNGNTDGDTNPAFTINPATGVLTVNDAGDLNFEAASSINLFIQVSDGTNLSELRTVLINIVDRPEPPLDIILTNNAILENNALNAPIGSLASISTEVGNNFTYTLVAGTGGADNASFRITGNQLSAAETFNAEAKSTYNIRIRSTAQSGEFLEKAFVINVGDVNESPTLGVIADQLVCVSANETTINLPGLTAGPETGQTLTVTATNDNPGLFASFGIVNNTLRFRINAGLGGPSTVTITVKDNGGTANGGVDQVQRKFVITASSIAAPVITSNKGLQVSKGDIVELTATGGVTYAWDPAAGIVSGQNSAVLVIRPTENTTYRVTATNADGCIASQSVNIEVLTDYKVDGVNILTPNGDGINDRFVIRNIDTYPNNELKIFDRSGRIIYQKRGYLNEWAATVNGNPLQEGTYYYILDFGPGLPKVKGFITVIRDK
ncbi:gliding motility-associated C-terminal domain-containing protein [Chitinophaga horti]|uniref:Gliding motility-associated C-terminal domain-containing protein n=1 Tax=Chitinophaga horti TaxID=2920382 RepID=A0ABY6JBA2_9BACT|nr:gliding motility-associated C-terminal domain-containing protein [Chitinophaga horti]UYQ95576.1 gliding motility-associated C-terminal domain-containing protein [Chitinophaga horti]